MNANDESQCDYVCSRGLLKSCDIKSTIPISSITQLVHYDWSALKDGCTIYVCNRAMIHFSSILSRINCKFILVSGDCDVCCPTEQFQNQLEFTEFIRSDKIIHWFSQNLVIDHPKMTKMPIGLDYHTMTSQNHWGPITTTIEQESILKTIQKNASPFFERIPKCYSNFHFFTKSKYGYDRVAAQKQIPSSDIFYESTNLERSKTWENQSKYAFVVSPHGNGLDCHRTWEALCLGNIVIVKTSALDSLYDGLPVYIVNEWSDIHYELLQTILKDYRIKYENGEFQMEKLTLQYWVSKIRSYGNMSV